MVTVASTKLAPPKPTLVLLSRLAGPVLLRLGGSL